MSGSVAEKALRVYSLRTVGHDGEHRGKDPIKSLSN